jgi:hypothetical protein
VTSSCLCGMCHMKMKTGTYNDCTCWTQALTVLAHRGTIGKLCVHANTKRCSAANDVLVQCLNTPRYPSDSRWSAGSFGRPVVLLTLHTLLAVGCSSGSMSEGVATSELRVGCLSWLCYSVAGRGKHIGYLFCSILGITKQYCALTGSWCRNG